MKKIISIIAALAMLGAFVGCGPIEWSDQTLTISNSKKTDTAYYITDVEVDSGESCLQATIALGKSGPSGNVVTLKSIAPGDASVIFYSSVSGKRAVVPITVYSSGLISGTTKLEYTTYNESGIQSLWEDWKYTQYHDSEHTTVSKLDPLPQNGYYYLEGTTSDDWSVLKVQDDIFYFLQYNSSSDVVGFETDYYYWARALVKTTTSGKLDAFEWDTFGKLYVGKGQYIKETLNATSEDRSTTTKSKITKLFTVSSATDYNYTTNQVPEGENTPLPLIEIGTKKFWKWDMSDPEDEGFTWTETWKLAK